MTTNQGIPVSDNQNTLSAGPPSPHLLEDFVLREKIQHFDHERIPEWILHARGSAARGVFELTDTLADHTTAKILTDVGKQTELFTRFSTVAGGAGSVDTPRDVRGFAVKAEADGATVKIVAPKIGGLTLKGGKKLKADGQPAGTPSVVFDAVALVLSEAGCAELLKESAAVDFAAHAFVHLKAIGHTPEVQPLLDKANVEADAGVVDLSEGADASLTPARTRLWDREPKIRMLA